jgi:hypothetical protein
MCGSAFVALVDMEMVFAQPSGESKAGIAWEDQIPCVGPLTEQARRLTRLGKLLLQPIVRREAVVAHPVNGYELVEQALATNRMAKITSARPLAVETPRHIFLRQHSASNCVLPIAVGT